jgi:hypothetical protein
VRKYDGRNYKSVPSITPQTPIRWFEHSECSLDFAWIGNRGLVEINFS